MAKLSSIFAKIPQYILPIVLCGWCAVLLAQKIDLPTADLGRHIENGSIILHGSWADKWQLLHTNFYSYTEPDHSFVNHHWLSGVVFYVIHQLAGFKGLSVVYIFVVTLAFLLFYSLAQKRAGSAVASILAVLVLPIIASRAEVRPEGFTYLMMALFFWLLWHWKEKADKSAHYIVLIFLPLLMLLWVNLHIGFIFGFLIFGAFWLQSIIKWKLTKNPGNFYFLSFVGALCVVAGLINPFFIKGLLYPLNIFREYGYRIVENQSVMFLQKLGMGNGLYFGLFKILLGLAGLSFIARLIKERRKWKEFPYHEFLLLATAGFLALLATRNFPIFGLLFLPIAAANIKAILPEVEHEAYKILPALIAIVVLIFGSFRFLESYQLKRSNFGVGLMPGVERAAEFFKAQKIKGPVFNNYDIGGYLIYELSDLSAPSQARGISPSPGESNMERAMVFTDNRPEAYSIDHFQKDYIPAQEDEVKWKELDSKYNFNAIFFSHRDLTPWGQAFLISKVQDEEWAPIFADQYNIIFIKKNLENVELIRKYLIPKENFGIINN